MFEFLKQVAWFSVGGQLGVPDSLRGRYDLLGDTLMGYVRTENGRPSRGLEIVVLRNGQEIASCTPAPVAGDSLQHFTLPIDGRFNTAELASDTVTVGARNRRGDTGTLILHGPTKQELVRDHFGAPSETIFDLDFTDKGNARPFLGAGWWRAEKDYTWTTDDESVVTFPAPEAPGQYLLRLTCAPYILDSAPLQTMDIRLDGQHIASIRETEGLMQFNEFRMNAADFTARPTSTLQFEHVNAVRPSEHTGNSDTRRLAFRFRRMALLHILAGTN